ncbi:MAG: SNF2-related protein, partial [Chloroflexales bacterium]
DHGLGADLRVWRMAALLAVELVAGQQILPALVREGSNLRACWEPRPVPATARKIAALRSGMPALCRAITENPTAAPAPRALVDSFLAATVDALARQIAADDPTASAQLSVWRSIPPTPGSAWMVALLGRDPGLSLRGRPADELFKAWQAWAGQEQVAGDESFRITFRLEPPTDASAPWSLSYLLQATDDPSLLVPAAQLWRERGQHFTYLDRRFDHPQERLLRGLGFAARLAPPIERSLRGKAPDHASMNVEEAFGFLKDAAPLLEQSGFGVLVPAWWGNSGRLKARAKASPRKGKRNDSPGRLSFQSMIDFRWELSVGEQPIDRAEFERLVELKQPLVQVRGEWVVLDPEQARKAMDLFTKGGELSMAELLRMGLGGISDGLPAGMAFGGVDAEGDLGMLLRDLSNTESITPLPQPDAFQGTLRPYQLRGLAWMAFMRRFGMGACLADDMGLGKCLLGSSLIYVNGTLSPVEQIWEQFAGATTFDGEGFWADPSASLQVNAIDGATGKIVTASVRRLYRQRINESLRTVRLEDGSSITITGRHRLLTNQGWTNNLAPGDYVCVPAHLTWQGTPADLDLIKVLAWQIAEGHENHHNATVTLTQADQAILEDLRATLHAIGDRYGLKLNTPAIYTYAHKASYLRWTSRAYQHFLVNHGYQWGKLSAEKVIPDLVMQSDDEGVRVFLRNYFDAEASVIVSMDSIEISSASSLLMQQLGILLRRLGIWMRVSQKRKRATNGSGIYRTYHIGVIGGNSARRFLREVGFGIAAKQRILEQICISTPNTNVEGVPASTLVVHSVRATGLPVRMFGMHNTVYLNGSQQFSRQSLARVLAGMDGILSGEAEKHYRLKPASKWTVKTLTAFAQLNRDALSTTRGQIQQLLDQEVHFCRIRSIETQMHEGWVYDLEVAEHHNFVANSILCHNTAEAISLLLYERDIAPDGGPTLLVCPTSVVGNWQRELARFAPSLRVHTHQGAERHRGDELEQVAGNHDVVITSYPLLARDREALTTMTWRLAVLDEAQNIKNSETRQAQAARAIRSDGRLALTGTPVENRLSELWSIMAFLNPGYLGGETEFRRTFARPIERAGDADAATQLRRLTAPFILRRLKTDRSIISDLPDKLEMKVFVPLTQEQATLYEATVRDALSQIEGADDEGEKARRRGLVLAMLTKLKQICNHPAHFLKDGSALDDRSGKLARLDEMLEEVIAADDRALIFTQFAEMGSLLQAHLSERLSAEALFLHGGTPAKSRDGLVRRFQAPEGPPIFILSLKAGGVGLNLTRASHVFHFDRWWNPAVEDQATDRAFRIGQTKNVQVHKFVCGGTLEEKIDEMIEGKRALAAQVLGAGEAWLTELSTAQLRELVALRRDAEG